MRRHAIVAQALAGAALAFLTGCYGGEGSDVPPLPPPADPGPFTEMNGNGLAGIVECSIAWGDADNDGDLDMAIAGMDDNDTRITKVYENVGGPAPFDGTELATGLAGVNECSLAWGDCDNDGDLDLAVAGYTGVGGRITKVYENTGGALPFDGRELATGLTGVGSCSLAWGDCDNDGDLDLAVAGSAGGTCSTRVHANDAPFPNLPPAAPTGLGATPSAGETLLTWLPASDWATRGPGLSYNLRVRDAGTPATVIDGMADPATGWRRIPALGPVRPDVSSCSWTLKDLAPGDYEFRVQAIDSGFAGGPWSAAEAFTVPAP